VLDIAFAVRSEPGQREHNEDKVRVSRDGALCAAVLADGAGGHRGGAEASQRAVDRLEAALHDAAPPFGSEALTRAVLSAHAHVRAGQGDADGLGRMHTTVVVLWIDGANGFALWSHVGDSRLYRARRGLLSLLTVDDSVVQSMVDAGLLTLQQAQVHPQKNQLIAALGIEDDIEPHTVPQPVALQDGDAFLLCSDGWWSALDDSGIVGALADASTPDEWLAGMQRRIEARAVPRQDNFSAIGVWVGDVAEATRPIPLVPP